MPLQRRSTQTALYRRAQKQGAASKPVSKLEQAKIWLMCGFVAAWVLLFASAPVVVVLALFSIYYGAQWITVLLWLASITVVTVCVTIIVTSLAPEASKPRNYRRAGGTFAVLLAFFGGIFLYTHRYSGDVSGVVVTCIAIYIMLCMWLLGFWSYLHSELPLYTRIVQFAPFIGYGILSLFWACTWYQDVVQLPPLVLSALETIRPMRRTISFMLTSLTFIGFRLQAHHQTKRTSFR